MDELGPRFETSGGYKLALTFNTLVMLNKHLHHGDVVDLMITSRSGMDEPGTVKAPNGALTSPFGYNSPSQPPPRHVRSTPRNGLAAGLGRRFVEISGRESQGRPPGARRLGAGPARPRSRQLSVAGANPRFVSNAVVHISSLYLFGSRSCPPGAALFSKP